MALIRVAVDDGDAGSHPHAVKVTHIFVPSFFPFFINNNSSYELFEANYNGGDQSLFIEKGSKKLFQLNRTV